MNVTVTEDRCFRDLSNASCPAMPTGSDICTNHEPGHRICASRREIVRISGQKWATGELKKSAECRKPLHMHDVRTQEFSGLESMHAMFPEMRLLGGARGDSLID